MTRIDQWREKAISRFAHDLLDECARHGGLDAYAKKIGVQEPNIRVWVENRTRPSYKVALRMAKISPVLIPHLEERECLTDGGRRKRSHARHMTAAKRRALKLRREPLIREAARKVNARVHAMKQEAACPETAS